MELSLVQALLSSHPPRQRLTDFLLDRAQKLQSVQEELQIMNLLQSRLTVEELSALGPQTTNEIAALSTQIGQLRTLKGLLEDPRLDFQKVSLIKSMNAQLAEQVFKFLIGQPLVGVGEATISNIKPLKLQQLLTYYQSYLILQKQLTQGTDQPPEIKLLFRNETQRLYEQFCGTGLKHRLDKPQLMMSGVEARIRTLIKQKGNFLQSVNQMSSLSVMISRNLSEILLKRVGIDQQIFREKPLYFYKFMEKLYQFQDRLNSDYHHLRLGSISRKLFAFFPDLLELLLRTEHTIILQKAVTENEIDLHSLSILVNKMIKKYAFISDQQKRAVSKSFQQLLVQVVLKCFQIMKRQLGSQGIQFDKLTSSIKAYEEQQYILRTLFELVTVGKISRQASQILEDFQNKLESVKEKACEKSVQKITKQIRRWTYQRDNLQARGEGEAAALKADFRKQCFSAEVNIEEFMLQTFAKKLITNLRALFFQVVPKIEIYNLAGLDVYLDSMVLLVQSYRLQADIKRLAQVKQELGKDRQLLLKQSKLTAKELEIWLRCTKQLQ